MAQWRIEASDQQVKLYYGVECMYQRDAFEVDYHARQRLQRLVDEANFVEAWHGGYEQISAAAQFCAGYTPDELKTMMSLRMQQAQKDSLAGLLLDVRDDSVKQIQLLKSLVGQVGFRLDERLLEVQAYLTEKGVRLE